MKKLATLLTALSMAAFSIGCGEGEKPVANGNGTDATPADHDAHEYGTHDAGEPDATEPGDPLEPADPADPLEPADPTDIE